MAKMTTCKTCGQPIAKNAKVCPHCGAKIRKHTLLKIIAAVVVLGMIGSVFGGRKSPDAGQNGAAVKENETARAETQAAEESPLSDETAASETESVKAKPEAETAAPADEADTTQPPAEEEHVSDTSSPETTETVVESSETAAESTEVSADSTEDQSASADGVTPELKKFLDEYEAFVNDYCDFMETYDQSDTSAMMEYLSLLQKYADFAEAADAYDQDEMSDADLKYYLEVTTRIEKRLLEVSTN